ncbi:MAG: hypothetical protein JNK02_07170 [Planctomycetes bacterium]|nr:hypothetical protein [Planctomycetota bacterium]
MLPRSALAAPAALGLVLLGGAPPAAAQDGPPRARLVGRLPSELEPRPLPSTREQRLVSAGARPAIVMTGYWPPSNEAVRRFSPSPAQNPAGWIGSNWENRGYDVYAFFPEFSPPTCTNCGQGSGDFEVDYQDTSADFWPIVNAIQPIAILTFSRTNEQFTWEVELNAINFTSWVNDYTAPLQPTPSPPDASVPGGTLRLSSLPMQTIVDDVNTANLGLLPFICMSNNSGSFLSGFMAYHGVWYQSLHAAVDDPARCIAAGHIHVGRSIPFATARLAAEVTLRSVIRHVDATLDPACSGVDLLCATTQNSVGPGAILSTAGSTSVGLNSLRFLVTGMPPNQVGSLVYSASTTPPIVWGNGLRCIAAPFQRLGPILPASPAGFLDRGVDFTLPPLASGPFAALPGSTWNFQYVYRDPAAGGANFDTTNGAAVTFCP